MDLAESDLSKSSNNFGNANHTSLDYNGSVIETSMKNAEKKIFSNYLILKEIFSHLRFLDLLSCRKVSKTWLQVVNSSSKDLRLFRITIDHNYENEGERIIAKSLDICPFSGSQAPVAIFDDIETLAERLRIASQKYRILINVRLTVGIFSPDNISWFLSEFGHLVYGVNFQDSLLELEEFMDYLSFFPHALVITWRSLRNNLIPKEVIVRSHVERIYWGVLFWGRKEEESLKLIRKAFPNVKGIFDVPVTSLGFIQELGMLNLVKSMEQSSEISDVLNTDFRLYGTYFKQLALFNAGLTHVQIPDTRHLNKHHPKYSLESGERRKVQQVTPPNDQCFIVDPSTFHQGTDERAKELIQIQNEFYRLLETSPTTAKTLTISPLEESIHYLPFPLPLPNVKILRYSKVVPSGIRDRNNLWKNSEKHFDSEERERRIWTRRTYMQDAVDEKAMEEYGAPPEFFPSNTSQPLLTILLPGLNSLEVNEDLYKEDLPKYFPTEIFTPDVSSRIKALKIKGISPECLESLVSLFPNVENVEMLSTITHFTLIFPTICKGWPNLYSLKFYLESQRHGSMQEDYYWDTILSGIPKDVCKRLRSFSPEQNISPEILSMQHQNSSLLDLNDLNHLEFILGDQHEQEKRPSRITGEIQHLTVDPVQNFERDPKSVQTDYAMSVLPNHRNLEWLEEFKATFTPIDGFVQVGWKYLSQDEFYRIFRQ